MKSKKINAGVHRVNKRYRIPLTTICKANGIKEGSFVRVYIEIVDMENE